MAAILGLALAPGTLISEPYATNPSGVAGSDTLTYLFAGNGAAFAPAHASVWLRERPR